MKSVPKNKNLRTASLIALITGGLMAGGITYTQNTSSDKPADKEIVKNYQDLSTDKIEQHINECNTALEKLKKIIESEKTNPEERFEARRAYNSILKKRTEMQKELNSRQKNTIRFDSVRYDR